MDGKISIEQLGWGEPRMELYLSDRYVHQCGICQRQEADEDDDPADDEWNAVYSGEWVTPLADGYALPHPFQSWVTVLLCDKCDAEWSEHFELPAEGELAPDDISVEMNDDHEEWWLRLEIYLLPKSDGAWEEYVQGLRGKFKELMGTWGDAEPNDDAD